MKLMIRTLLILAAGMLVAGAMLAFGRSGLATQMRETSPRGGHFEGRSGPPAGFEGQGSAEGRAEGHAGGEHSSPNLFGITEVLVNLVKVGVIVTVVAIGARLLSLRRKARPASANTGQTTRL